MSAILASVFPIQICYTSLRSNSAANNERIKHHGYQEGCCQEGPCEEGRGEEARGEEVLLQEGLREEGSGQEARREEVRSIHTTYCKRREVHPRAF